MDVPNYLEPPGPWKPGIYDLDSYEQYDSIPALRSSHLRLLKKSPAHFAAAFDPRWKKPISPVLQKSFDKGKAFDILMLHGADDLAGQVAIEPDVHKATKIYKEWKHEHAGAIILSEREHDYIKEMRRRVDAKSAFSRIFSDGHPHKVVVWQDGTGIWCKAEIDWICSDSTVVDLKTTSGGADFWAFSRAAYRYGYLNQGAYYLAGLSAVTGIQHDQFMLAVCEVEPPFESQVFRATRDQLFKAEMENEECLSLLLDCYSRDDWPGYPDHIIDLDSGQIIDEDYTDYDNIENLGGF